MASLDLLVPGLLGPWPSHQLEHVCEDFDAPNLARLLVRGDVGAQSAADDSVAGAVLGAFGLASPGPAAAAAWRCDGADTSGDGNAWLRVDPVSLRAEPHGAVMIRGEALGLDGESAGQLAAALADIGGQPAPRVGAPSRWYLPCAPDIETRAPSSVWGPAVREALPEGPDGARWRAWLTEAQMILHALPLNDEREEAGLAPVNSVWLWGSGTLDAPPDAGYDRVVADDPVARGLALADGLEPEALPTGTGLPEVRGRTLVVLERLHGLARGGSVEGWRDAVALFDQTWALEVVEGLLDGRIDTLRLLAPPAPEVRVTRRALRRFWRRPRSIAVALERVS